MEFKQGDKVRIKGSYTSGIIVGSSFIERKWKHLIKVDSEHLINIYSDKLVHAFTPGDVVKIKDKEDTASVVNTDGRFVWIEFTPKGKQYKYSSYNLTKIG